jgi:glycosyltransferase involved in cell wall biosynthesis
MQSSFDNMSALNIAFCVPRLHQDVSTDASLLQQILIASQLTNKGQRVTFFAPKDLESIEESSNLIVRTKLNQTWTGTNLFKYAGAISWRIQQMIGIPFMNFFTNMRWFDALVHRLEDFDIVQERNGLYKNAAAMACSRLHLPYILFFDADDLHEHDYVGDPIKGILRWRAEQMMGYNLRMAQRVICVSQATKQRLINVWHTPAEKIEVFPNAVDVDLYRPYPDSLRSSVRASFGIHEQPLIVFVGGFYPWHDVKGLLSSFEMMIRSHPEARLLLVGDGPQRPAMEKQAAASGISDKVIFTGRVAHDEVPHLISAADIAVAPYPQMDRDEFWFSPMKLFEYMACGKAVVASDLGQIADAIQDGQNGLLVPAGSTSALADAVVRLIEDQTLRSRLGEQARRTAVENYSWEQYINRLTGLYAQVIAEFSTSVRSLK